MAVGISLFLGKDLDTCVQNYINALRRVGVVMAVANCIPIERMKAWGKSIFQRMGNAPMLERSQLDA